MTRKPAPIPALHRPEVLLGVSLERIEEAEWLLKRGSWALAMYVAGLSVEALLQAFALGRGQRHDARHNLDLWLSKGPATLSDAIRSAASQEWSTLRSLWDNDLRYLSFSARWVGSASVASRTESRRGVIPLLRS